MLCKKKKTLQRKSMGKKYADPRCEGILSTLLEKLLRQIIFILTHRLRDIPRLAYIFQILDCFGIYCGHISFSSQQKKRLTRQLWEKQSIKNDIWLIEIVSVFLFDLICCPSNHYSLENDFFFSYFYFLHHLSCCRISIPIYYIHQDLNLDYFAW